MMNKKFLMSYDEYSKIKHETPYFYSVKSKDKLLYYFGVSHSRDPKHSQFDLLIQKWNEFTEQSKDYRTAVIIETNKIPGIEPTLDEYIKKYGEIGAGAYLARNNSSLLIFGEPKTEEVINHLLKEFSREEILLFFESIALKFWHTNKTGRNMQDFLLGHTDKYSKLLSWPDLVISTDLIKEIYKKIFSEDLDINNKEIFSKITSPVTLESRVNKVSRSQSLYRNEYVLDQIEKYWNEGYNLFIIYGAGHAVIQEPVTRSLIEN